MRQPKSRELLDELRTVFAGRYSFLDAILPPILFLLVNGLAGFQAAMWSALALSVVIAAIRISRKQSITYALAGVGSVAVAIGIAWFLGKSEGFFLPGLVSGSMTLLLTIVSLVIRRPMVAWTSYIARRWPLDWYWHPQVRPAYSEVTFAWALFFAARLLLQFSLFESKDVNSLAVTNFITGWPATILLLVFSYLYGTWRLAHLHGPSVDEFRSNTPAPWQGQRRGF
jgi:intracellular septation protein A